MRDKRVILIGIFLVIFLGTYLNWEFCCKSGEEAWGTSEEPSAVIPDNVLTIADPEGDFFYSHSDHFNFYYSDYLILPPLGSGVRAGVDSLRSYLEDHPGRFVEVTGFYHSQEKNSSEYPDLGLARAAQIKNYLIGRGVKPKQINYFGERADSLSAHDSIFKGPVVFSFSGIPEAHSDVNGEFVEEFNSDPLVIRFEWGESEISLSAPEREKLTRISDFMKRLETGYCLVTGHTDNSSSARFNKQLGLKRAQFVKNYLVSQGIPSDRIVISSMGETVPVGDNDTESGRARNRRTVVTISQ